MADYSNYSIVSWTDATPITSTRLGQMSTNITEVKDANDDKPKGLLKISNGCITSAPDSGAKNAAVHVIALRNSGGVDNRVTLDSLRWYRLMVVIPDIEINAGHEDAVFKLRIHRGTFGASLEMIIEYRMNSGIGAFYNVASDTALGTNTITNTNVKFGGGTYSFVYTTAAASQSFFVEIEKVQGASTANQPNWSIANPSKVQFYIEDIGGVA